jgi:antitoxin (DNA-binding transcriptional repressor) of toxin-antitoxin stability system
VKAITIEELHRETERWVKEAAVNGGIVVTEGGTPVASIVQPEAMKRPAWLQERLADIERLPFVPTDSSVYVSEDRDRA